MQFSLYSDSSKTPDTDLTCLYYISVTFLRLKLQHWKITLLLFIVLSWLSYSKQQKKRVFASWVKNTESIFELKQNKKREEGSLKELK